MDAADEDFASLLEIPDAEGNTPLHLLCLHGHLTTFKVVNRKVKAPEVWGDIFKQYNHILYIACKEKHFALAEYIIEEAVNNPNIFNYSNKEKQFSMKLLNTAIISL